MTFPPTNQGYPQGQPPGSYGSQPPAGYGPPSGPSKLPQLLLAAVAGFGLLIFLFSFGPVLKMTADLAPFAGAQLTGSGSGFPTIAAVVAALLAVIALLPKAKDYHGVIAVSAVLALLLVIAQMVSKPAGFAIGWALWLILFCSLLQAVAAVTALLVEAELVTLPAPRPNYDPYGPYGPPPGGYFAPPSGLPQSPQQHGPQQHGPQQRPNYGPQYGSGYPQGPSTGGFGAPEPDSGPPTPPTGFPSFSPPRPNGPSQPAAGQPGPAESPSDPKSP